MDVGYAGLGQWGTSFFHAAAVHNKVGLISNLSWAKFAESEVGRGFVVSSTFYFQYMGAGSEFSYGTAGFGFFYQS